MMTQEIHGRSFLERRTVSAQTESRYTRLHAHWSAWVKRNHRKVDTVAQVDGATVEYMNHEYRAGRRGYQSSQLLAALGYILPMLTRGAPQLVRARQAARGWLKLSPNHSRLPIPWPAVAGIIHQL
eukprot:6374256-Amphidinium_carterae.1